MAAIGVFQPKQLSLLGAFETISALQYDSLYSTVPSP